MHAATFLAIILAGSPLFGQTPNTNRSDLPQFLDFEAGKSADAPVGWSGGPLGTIFADDAIIHGGKWAARLDRNSASAGNFSTMTIAVPVNFGGSRIELRGFLKTEDVSQFAGLWMREDDDTGSVAFENMQSRQINGTHDWTEYSIQLPLRPQAKRLFFGVLMGGTGKTWADDLTLTVDGKPIWDVPAIQETPLDTDQEFDGGSGINLTQLSKTQTENLATLGKVWGFLKYHHPAITSGLRHWDYELFRVLPEVLATGNRAAANSVMHRWIASLGAVPECVKCARLSETNLYMKPDIDWIANEKSLGADLSQDLRLIYKNRPADEQQFYVSLRPEVGNPLFLHDLAYPRITLPDAGFQLLALYRFWNIVEYWYPYRDVMKEDWDGVLVDFIPRISLARTSEDYKRELMLLISRLHDTHATLSYQQTSVLPPVGDCRLPVAIRFVGNRAVVWRYLNKESGPASGLQIGDVILALDGTPVRELVSRWRQYYGASNDAARLRDIGRSMTNGACGPSSLQIQRNDQTLTLTAARVSSGTIDLRTENSHDLGGATFQKLSDDVAYLKLSSARISEAAQYIDLAKGSKGLIIDIRNYPAEFIVFALGQLLVQTPTEFARFTKSDISNPRAFHWTSTTSLIPQQPYYSGKVFVLVDEVSLSQAEYTAMAFRAAGAIVIGSTTAGADGDVSEIPLPGGLRTAISGIGVFYPDKKPTQRVGIIPDITVRPTIAGIRSGRDEVLEAAIQQIEKK
jgi:C-terminal processing protease CtpA/Prc